MRRRRLGRMVGAALGVLVGYAVGAAGGAYLLERFIRTVGESGGWEDLAASAGSLITFGPLGGALGLAAVTRPRLDPDQRRWLVAAVATALAAGVVIWFSVGTSAASVVTIWSVTAAILLWVVSFLRRR